MKKFYYLAAGIVMILVTIMACEKSAIGVDETLTVKDEVLLSKGAKVDVCHWDDEYQVWVPISIAPEAVQKHMDKHGDKYSFSPLGEIYFYYETGGILKGLHSMYITTWDGSTFTGDGVNLNSSTPGYYERESKITATIVNQENMRFEGTFTYPGYSGSYAFDGYIDECGGIILDNESGDFYGPVTKFEFDTNEDGFSGLPIPN